MKDQKVKQHIIDMVKPYLFTYGSSGVSMSQLAKELRMSKKTIYKYFKSKEELTISIIDNEVNKLEAALEKIVQDSSIPILEKIKLLIRKKVEIISEVKPPFIRDIDKHCVIKKQVDQVEEKIVPNYLGIVLEEAQKMGLVRKDIDLRIFNEIIRASIDRIINFETLNRLSISADRAMELVFDICINGILLKEGDSS